MAASKLAAELDSVSEQSTADDEGPGWTFFGPYNIINKLQKKKRPWFNGRVERRYIDLFNTGAGCSEQLLPQTADGDPTHGGSGWKKWKNPPM